MYRLLIFKSRWGWMAVSETTEGLDAIVLPKSSRQAGGQSCKRPPPSAGRPHLSRLRGPEATGRIPGRKADIV